MFLSSARLILKNFFSSNGARLALNLHKGRCFSSITVDNGLEYIDGIARDVIMATPGPRSIVAKNPITTSTTIPDDVWSSNATHTEFLSYFPGILDELVAKTATFSTLDNGKRIRRVMEYVMPGSPRFLGITATETYKIIAPKDKHTPENLKMAYYLGWCLEIVVESLNMVDDMMDTSSSRRNQTCWHNLPDVGASAVNDEFMMHSGTFYLLKKHFGHLDCYMRLLDIFNESILQACVGQYVDVDYIKKFENIGVEAYQEIVTNVSTYLTCYFPIALGMTLAGHRDLTFLKKAKKVLTGVAYFYIIQNDYNDCFSDENLTGKLGTDIQEGKSRWTNVIALELASTEQKAILKDNIGRHDPQCVARVMDIYRELDLPSIFEDYSENLCNRLTDNLNELDGDTRKVCEKLVESVIYSKNTRKPLFL